jgi:hypothetical protein
MREDLEDLIASIIRRHAVLTVRDDGGDGFGGVRFAVEIANAARLAQAIIRECEDDVSSSEPRHRWPAKAA